MESIRVVCAPLFTALTPMYNKNFSASSCRLCSYYYPQGRRGGECQLLGVPVKGCWAACNLATYPFATAPSLESTLEPTLESNIVYLEQALSLDCETGAIHDGEPIAPTVQQDSCSLPLSS